MSTHKPVYPEDRLLFDATKRLSVVIDAIDRTDDVFCSPTRCVGANRIRRLPGVLDVRVGATSARVKRKNGWHRYDLAPETIAAIRAYDEAHEKMPPGFRFVLLPPKKRLNARKGEKPGTNVRSGRNEHVATRRPSSRSMFVEPE